MSNQENISKETKKTRRKKSQRKAQQIKLAVIMIMVSVLVLSASTFAWYQMNKTANLTNMQFTADTLGNLLISESKADGYTNTLDLKLDVEGSEVVLLPATTGDGKTFFEPNYGNTSDTVSTVKMLNEEDDANTQDVNESEVFEQFVYKRVFYIKSGVQPNDDIQYDLKLVDGDFTNTTGTYLKDSDGDGNTEFTSLDAVRVSFVFGEGAVFDDQTNETIKVYKPYSRTDDDTKGDATIAYNNVSKDDYGPKAYETITLTQENDGTIVAPNNGSTTLCTIKEGTPVKVTMYVWFEGMDDDCGNEIALDTIAGQIQFEAEEKTN